MTDLTLVVTGALYGRRLKGLGPKPLWPVADTETVFECQLRSLNREATERPIVVAGFESEKVRSGVGHLARVIHNREWETLGCGCSAQLGLYHARPGRVILAHGDVLLSRLVVPPSGSWVIAADNPGRGCGEVGVTADGGWVENLEYGLRPRWAQAVVLDKAERDLFQDLPLRHELLYEALNQTIDKGGRFQLHAPSGLTAHDMDRKADIAGARAFRKRFIS